MAKTYDRHEIGKKISALLKIVLFRDNSDTVLTETSEISSRKNGDNIIDAKIAKNKTKPLKKAKKKISKQNSMEVEQVLNIFNEK